VIQGDKEAVDALLEHPDVQAVSFVGSTPIAKYIQADRRQPTASACRPWAGQRTTWW
jgi:acyl-CoA reductase-like NAD-dependent aldehyde dehydrogenase